MHKIDTENRTANDEFQDADESQSILGTDLNAAWFNTIQRELCNLVTKMGISLNASDDTQVFKAVKEVGIKVNYCNTGAYTVPENWSGSTILLVSARDLTITGGLQYGASLIIVPWWTSNSPDSIKVYYNNDYVTVRKGSGFFGMVLNGSEELELAAYPFAVPDNDGCLHIKKVNVANINAANYVDNGVVTDSNVTGSNGEYRPWQLSANWAVGQVKRVRSIAGASKYRIQAYTSTSGTLSYIEMPTNGYRELLCIGKFKRSDNVEYAVFAVNGGTFEAEESA